MARTQSGGRTSTGEQQLIVRAGPLGVDWPRSAGYFGGVALAVATGIVDPPLGLFIAAVPFVKMLNQTDMPTRLRLVGQFFEGASKPVGGDAEGTVWIENPRPVRGALRQPRGGGRSRSQSQSPRRSSRRS